LAIGAVLLALVTGATWLAVGAGAESALEPGAIASTPPVALITASVDRAGTLSAPDLGWEVDHTDVGRYELSFPTPTNIAVRTWATPAGVTVRPISLTAWLVTFAAGDEPVDAAFSFLASPVGAAE
jgi:hypothetical protein